MNMDNQTAGRLSGLAFAGAAGLHLLVLVCQFIFGYSTTLWNILLTLLDVAGIAALGASQTVLGGTANERTARLGGLAVLALNAAIGLIGIFTALVGVDYIPFLRFLIMLALQVLPLGIYGVMLLSELGYLGGMFDRLLPLAIVAQIGITGLGLLMNLFQGYFTIISLLSSGAALVLGGAVLLLWMSKR